MTNDEIKTLIESAKGLARARGHGEIADDFSQEAVMALFGGRKATLDQLLVDHLRREYGDSRCASFAQRNAAQRQYVEISAPECQIPGERCAASDPGSDDLARRINACLTFREWQLVSALEAGESPREIAFDHGVTESRVSQLMKPLRRKIESMKLMADELQLFRLSRSVLVVDWITL